MCVLVLTAIVQTTLGAEVEVVKHHADDVQHAAAAEHEAALAQIVSPCFVLFG